MKTAQTILITGATAGIGKHAALHLAKRGHRVIASGRRPEALAKLAADAQAQGTRLETLTLDVTDEASISAAAAEVARLTDGRGLDVLVNNAGYGQLGPIETLSDADLRRQFETNVFGLVATTRAFLPAMRARGAGRIVNIGSVAGLVTFPLGGAYHGTKYAVEAISDALRRELLVFGVDVVLVEPGAIATEFGDRAMDSASRYRDASSPYAELMAKADVLKARTDRLSAGPESVTKAITHAIEARRPRARYVAPFSARFIIGAARTLPTRWMDRIMVRMLGVSRAVSRASS